MGREDPVDDDVFDYGLFLLNEILQESGHSLHEFDMPLPQQDWNMQALNPLIAEQLDYNNVEERERANANVEKLNEEQKSAYAKIVESVEHRRGKIFFLNGAGGTGKTFVYNTIAHKIRSEYWIVLCVASSGIAALLLIGGRTAHSVFKIPIDGLTDESSCNIPVESQRAALIRMTRLIIWDEALMQHRNCHEALDKSCRDIFRNELPFGGLTVVFGGDFQQILPVVPKGTQEDIIDASLRRSTIWNHVEVLQLKKNMRLEGMDAEEADFARWLLDVGHGRNNMVDGTVELPDGMVCRDCDTLVDAIYPEISGPTPPPQYFLERTILAARNGDVDGINENVLRRLAGESKTFLSADKVVCEAGADDPINDAMPPEYLRSLDASGLPPGELTLKTGCPLILLRNLAPARGLCNGTRMVVRRMSDRVLEVEILGGTHNGEVAFIPRITLTPSGDTSDFAFVLSRLQFPVRLAFAISINKAQGQSVKYVGVDVRVPVFTHGQLYVALSRATSHRRIKVLLSDRSLHNCTLNIVFPQVFE